MGWVIAAYLLGFMTGVALTVAYAKHKTSG